MLSLILPYWDRQEATDRSLALLAERYADLLDLEIVIVDDGSPVPYKAPQDYPLRLRIVRLPPKDGPKNPCVPINVGVNASDGDIIVLSNPEILHDMPVLPGMLDELERLGPDGYVLAAAWCPEEKQWHCHSTISGDRSTGERQPAGSGFHFCAMFHRSLWDKASGFDEDYRDGAGYDDPDWVNRAARVGAKFVIRDDLVVTHPKTGARTKWPEGGYARNRALFMQKWQAGPDLQLRIVCVKWGTDYDADYVNKLYAMVARNLAGGTPGQFICYTDNAEGLNPAITVRDLSQDLEGWWGKLALFREGEFTEGERVIFFDLDTVIVGPIDDLIRYQGEFAMLRDCYRPDRLGSGVMMWRGGFGADIWDAWEKAARPRVDGGDQAWIERIHPEAERLQDIFPGRFVSFKVDCNPYPPEGASVVYFHGWPKPHETDRKWVAEIWREGDGGGFSLALDRNTALATVKAQSEASAKLGLPHIRSKEPHDGHVSIVGGAPSMALSLSELHWRKEMGQTVWALNGTHNWLMGHGVTPDALVLLDAREENARFVQFPQMGVRYYVASQCHPAVYDLLRGFDVVRFDLDKLGNCGTTVGTHAMCLAFIEGFRQMHLYGFDSSYRDGEGHAYAQSLNDGEKRLEVMAGGRTFTAAPWMMQQALDLQSLSRDLMAHGCTITVHGDGLWPEVAKLMNKPGDLQFRKW